MMEVLRMARRERIVHDRATDEARNRRQERDADDIQDLPNREAMSTLTGLPSVPGLPAGLLGDNSATPIPTDPSAGPGDVNTISPTNNVTASNVDSAGTTQTTGALQDAPIVQR
jgi:hypothetical protein